MAGTMNALAPRQRLRDLGVTIGSISAGTHNAITDVKGVRVGHTTLISGEGPLKVGEGPVRTGVTVIVPHEGDMGQGVRDADFTHRHHQYAQRRRRA
jgi:L-aminopeptidase/D-esterase-like protein